jgi:DNA-binding transcriptional regulator YbjK
MTAVTRPSEVRERIIQAVLKIIGADGVAAVTNRRIAREAGVSLGSITYHFATQHDLLRESLRYFVDEETRRFTALAQQHCDNVTIEQASALVGQVASSADFNMEHIAPFELYIQAGRDPRLRSAAAECFAAYDRLAAKILAGLGVRDAERAASATVALVVGLQLRRLATGSTTDELVDALLLLTRGRRG